MDEEKVTLPSGDIISKEFYEKLISVTSKRPRMVIDKIMKDGSCTTDELIEMGYSHAPRAKRDVVEQGVPIKMKMVKNEVTGKKWLNTCLAIGMSIKVKIHWQRPMVEAICLIS